MQQLNSNKKKRVVFIILNYNTFEDTIRQVNEITEWQRVDFQIVIVDNDSPNNSFNILQDKFKESNYINVIKSPANGGFAKGNNYGLKYAKKYNPDFVCVINNDVHFLEKTIDSLCDIYDKLEKPAIIAPIQMLPGGKKARFKELKIPTFWRYLKEYSILFSNPLHNYCPNTSFPNVQKVEWIPGAFMFVKYGVFEKLGFFDEDTFLYGEESLLAGKVKNAGLYSYIILDQQYLHEHSKTISTVVSSMRQNVLQYEGRVIFLKKNEPSLFQVKKAVLWMAYIFNTACIIADKILKEFLKSFR